MTPDPIMQITRVRGREILDSRGNPTIEADVDPRNVASLRLLTGLGFEEISRASRTGNIGGAWCDSVYLRLLNTNTSVRGTEVRRHQPPGR